MPHGLVRCEMPASAATVFEVIHDYDRRLEWDSLLQEACLVHGAKEAGLNVCSVCRGKSWLGGFALETQYISFKPGEVAAVKLVHQPPLFETFAATIRHYSISETVSEVEYIYNFKAQPRWLRWILHPLMSLVFRWETRKRLIALRACLTRE